jgi:L-ascorbate metabolism protein UlaG (beta-lactamase superfamily)
MRHKALALFLLFAPATASFAARVQEHDASGASSFVWNDNSLIKVQKGGGDPARHGDVKIEFYGHNAFVITSPTGLTVLTDPWRNDSTGRYPSWFLSEFPAIRIDIVLSTHAHFDHDAVERPNGLVILERLIGQFKLGDVKITGLADKHKCEPALPNTCPPANVLGFDNAIQIIETGGLRIAIWGDNRPMPDPSLDHHLRNVDVLILPIETILTPAEVDSIVRKFDPKAVIPAHYFLSGLTTDVSQLESTDGWVASQDRLHVDVRRLDGADLTLNAAALKGSHHRIYYFGDHFAKK